jgi:hypothetical protein
VEVCKRKTANRNIFVAAICGTDEEMGESFRYSKDSFIVDITEKGQAILTCTVVSYKA